MTEGPEVAVLIHELGGMLSSVQGFAHIAEINPTHPDRERFIQLAAKEARRAAQALKDLHLARSLDRGGISPDPPAVAMPALMLAAAEEAKDERLRLVSAPDASVRVDPAKLAGLLARCAAAAIGPPQITNARDGVEIALALGDAAELGRRREALEAPYPGMLVFSLTRRLVRRWGGDLTIAAEGGSAVVTISLVGP